jgi:hypothetical protein
MIRRLVLLRHGGEPELRVQRVCISTCSGDSGALVIADCKMSKGFG